MHGVYHTLVKECGYIQCLCLVLECNAALLCAWPKQLVGCVERVAPPRPAEKPRDYFEQAVLALLLNFYYLHSTLKNARIVHCIDCMKLLWCADGPSNIVVVHTFLPSRRQSSQWPPSPTQRRSPLVPTSFPEVIPSRRFDPFTNHSMSRLRRRRPVYGRRSVVRTANF